MCLTLRALERALSVLRSVQGMGGRNAVFNRAASGSKRWNRQCGTALTAPVRFEHRPARQQTAPPRSGMHRRPTEALRPIPEKRGRQHRASLDFARFSAVWTPRSALVPAPFQRAFQAVGSCDHVVLLPGVISVYPWNVQSPDRISWHPGTRKRGRGGARNVEPLKISVLVYKQLIPARGQTVAFLQRLAGIEVNGPELRLIDGGEGRNRGLRCSFLSSGDES